MNNTFLFLGPGFGEIILVASLIFVSVLLLGLLIWSRWHWSIKATATVMAGIFFALTYFSILDMQGWPTKDALPEKFELVWYYVDPPNKKIGKDGFIVLWILESKNAIGRKPRSHLVDYNIKLHKKLNKARKKLMAGSRIRGEGKSKMKGYKPKVDSTYEWLRFYELPRPNPPRKH